MASKDNFKELLRGYSDDQLKYLNLRFSRRLGADLGEALECLQKQPDIDTWLAQAESANEFFERVDRIDQLLQNEWRRRSHNSER